MHKHDFDYSGRCLRWYEWLAFLVLFVLAAGVKAATPIYRCDDGRGAVTFQDKLCPAQEMQQIVTVPPAPSYAPSPTYAIDARAREARSTRVGWDHTRASSVQSWECRAADGQVFYRHRGCPRTIATSDASVTMRGAHRSKGGAASARTVSVHAVRIAREEACAQMRGAGALGRNGHVHDEDVSTYDKSLGRDLCH